MKIDRSSRFVLPARKIIFIISLMKRTVLCLSLLMAGLRAAAPSPEALLDDLRKEVRSAMKGDKSRKSGEDDPGRSIRYNGEMLLSQLPAGAEALGTDNLARTLQIIDQLHVASISDKANEICRTLSANLREQITQRQKTLKEKFESTVRSALDTGLNATKAREIDAPLQELARLQKEVQLFSYRGDGTMITNSEAASTVEQILSTIQDALLVKEGISNSARRDRDPTERLRSLSSSYGRQLGDIMPRSEFLQKIQAIESRIAPRQQTLVLSRQEFEQKTREIFSKIKKLEDIEGALAQFDALVAAQRDWNGYYGDNTAAYHLRTYRRTYEDLRAGSATSLSIPTISSSTSSNAENSEILVPLRNMLLKFALSRVLGTTGDLTPGENETVPTFLQRVLSTGLQSRDWTLVSRVLDTSQNLSLTSVISTSDSAALRHFLSGVNMEKAPQFSGAVASYLLALKSGSQAVPVEHIGTLLEKLKKDHLEEYKEGTQFANTSSNSSFPSSRIPTGFSIMPSSTLLNHPSLQNGTVIAIPAATAPPSAKQNQEKPATPPPAPRTQEKEKENGSKAAPGEPAKDAPPPAAAR